MTYRVRERDRRLGDALIERYVDWREECCSVRLAYARWGEACVADRDAAFAAYNEALDREQRASDNYAALIRQTTLPTPQRS